MKAACCLLVVLTFCAPIAARAQTLPTNARFAVDPWPRPRPARTRYRIGVAMTSFGSILAAAGLALTVSGGVCAGRSTWTQDSGAQACVAMLVVSAATTLGAIPLLVKGGWAVASGKGQLRHYPDDAERMTRAELDAEMRRARRWVIGGSVASALSLALVAAGIGPCVEKREVAAGAALIGVGAGAGIPSAIVLSMGVSRLRALRRAERGGPFNATEWSFAPWATSTSGGVAFAASF